MIKKVPRYLLTFFNTSGAIAVERFCKERGIPGRLIPVPREISASCGLSWAVLQEEKDCLELVEREFTEKCLYGAKGPLIIDNRMDLPYPEWLRDGPDETRQPVRIRCQFPRRLRRKMRRARKQKLLFADSLCEWRVRFTLRAP